MTNGFFFLRLATHLEIERRLDLHYETTGHIHALLVHCKTINGCVLNLQMFSLDLLDEDEI